MGDVDQAAFRRAAGQFPGGIVVVTTSGGHAMTVSAFASVSLEPPLVLFCAEKIARFHDAVLEAGAWAVSILAEDGEKTARWLATRGRPLDGQLDELPHHPGQITVDAPFFALSNQIRREALGVEYYTLLDGRPGPTGPGGRETGLFAQ